MEKTAVLTCKSCGIEKTITWGKGFFVTNDGREEGYEYSHMESSVREDKGISGFWVDKICKNCGKSLRESRYIEDTTNEYSVAWMSIPRVDIINKCDDCGSTDILTLYELVTGDDRKVPCSCCRQGKLEISAIV